MTQLSQPPPTTLIRAPHSEAGRSFASFYQDEHDGQVRRAFLLLGGDIQAHDVVAEAFIAVLRRWDDIDAPGPYLNRCVLNGCRDRRRTAGREEPVGEPAADAASPASTGPADDLAAELLTLPFRQRAAVVLRFYGGFSEAEIAGYLDCRPGTVGSLIHRALRRLRHLLEAETNS